MITEFPAKFWQSVFAVPANVCDMFIKTAPPDSLRVLLYLCRHGCEDITHGELSRATGVRDTEAALSFWTDNNVMSKADDNSETSEIINIETSKAVPTEILPEFAAPVPERRAGREYSPKEVVEYIREHDGAGAVFSKMRDLRGKELTHPERVLLIQIMSEWDLEPQVCLMLLDMCFALGKTTSGYIRTAAADFANRGITTVAAADAEIGEVLSQSRYESEVTAKLEIKTAVPKGVRDRIKDWHEWGMTADMVRLAYDIAFEQKGEAAYPYIHNVLKRWHTQGINTPEKAALDRKAFDTSKAEKYKKNSPQTSQLQKTSDTHKRGAPAFKDKGKNAGSSLEAAALAKLMNNKNDK